MVLLSFSIPCHIPLIQSGQKAQTTRIPRKTRKNGAKPYSVGEKAQLYYRSRQAKSCLNCIQECDIRCGNEDSWCKDWLNFFGETVITRILHYSKPAAFLGNEIWTGYAIGTMDDKEKDMWAIADGFHGGWDEACDFFEKSTKDPLWMYKDLDVLKWDGTMIVRRADVTQ